MQSISQQSDEEPRSAYNEDERSIKQRRGIERWKRRQEWLRMQELERKHEMLKQSMIEAYERKRAEKLKSKSGSLHHSRSRSRSKSPSRYHHREKIMSSVSKSDTASKKLGESTSGTVSFFKGPEDTQLAHINSTKLRSIKVTICNGSSLKSSATEIQRGIINLEEVVVPRRHGEGCKPLFDKEEIKNTGNSETEKRKVLDINKQATSTNKSITSKRRSLSLSPVRNHSHHSENHAHRPDYTSPSRNRYRSEELKLDKARYSGRKSDRRDSVERQREYKERDVRRYDNRSHSRERESRTSHSRSFTEEKFYPDRHRDRSRERSRDRRDKDRDWDRHTDRHRDRERNRDRDRERDRDRDRERDRDRDRDRERRDVATHYIEPVPVPIYYGNFPPRPIVISPIGPLRPVPTMGRGRHPPIMAPVRPFPPRLVPPDLYRMGVPPPNPRYGPMFQ